MAAESIVQLIGALGPLSEDILAILQPDDDTFVVRTDAFDAVLFVGADAYTPDPRITVEINVGAPPKRRALDVYRALLLYGMLYRETGGVRGALTEADGDVVLIADVSTQLIQPAELLTTLQNMFAKAAVWKAIVEAGAPDGMAELDFTGRETVLKI